MCNNSFCRVKFPNCLKHNISIQSINDEWWVYIIMDPHYSNNIFVYGTTHETGHKQPQICVIRKCTLFFSKPEEHTESLYYIPRWNWYLINFFMNCTYPRNVHIIKCHPNDTLPMSFLYIRCKQYLECIFCLWLFRNYVTWYRGLFCNDYIPKTPTWSKQ